MRAVMFGNLIPDPSVLEDLLSSGELGAIGKEKPVSLEQRSARQTGGAS